MKPVTTVRITLTAMMLAFGNPVASAIEIAAPVSHLSITDAHLATSVYAIESTEHWIAKLDAGDIRRADKLVADLGNQRDRLMRQTRADSAQRDLLIQHIDQLIDTLSQAASMAAPAMAAGAVATAATSTGGNAAQPDPNVTLVHRKLDSLDKLIAAGRIEPSEVPEQLEQIVPIFASIPVSNHPDYRAASERIAALMTSANTRLASVGMSDAEIGQYLAARQAYWNTAIPEIDFTDDGELTADAVDRYVAALTEINTVRDQDLQTLQSIVTATGRGKSLLRWLESGAMKKVTDNTRMYEQRLKSHVGYHYSRLEKLASLDPVENAYAFTNPDKQAVDAEHFQRVARTLTQAARLEASLGGGEAYADASRTFDAWLADWQQHIHTATAGRALPQDIGDESLRSIASDVLAQADYSVGEIDRLIVNAAIRDGESIDHKSTHSGIETIIREWQEFQVTTVERDNGKLIVYYNTLKNFSRAPTTTPVNRWILSKRVNSGEILASALQ